MTREGEMSIGNLDSSEIDQLRNELCIPHENCWAPYGGLAFPLDPQVLPPTCQCLQKTQFHHPTLLPAYKIKHLFIYNVGPIILF